MKPTKKVLITGASSGIGRATAIYLSEHKFIVYAGTRRVDKIANIQNKNLIPLNLDITNPESIKEALNRIDGVDILINNAGYGLVSTVEDVTEEEMFNQFNINLFGAIRMIKKVVPIMRAQNSGVIINISSFLGKIGLPLLTLYNASKYALEGVTDSLRYELRDFNIRVHSIMPGFFDTNFAKENLVVNKKTVAQNSPYKKIASNLLPQIIEQIENGNSASEVSELILEIINNPNYQARQTIGDKAKKFIPMRRELCDEDFERRVRDYYRL